MDAHAPSESPYPSISATSSVSSTRAISSGGIGAAPHTTSRSEDVSAVAACGTEVSMAYCRHARSTWADPLHTEERLG